MKAEGKPYRTGRGNEEYQKGYEGGGEGVKTGTGKEGGGVTQQFSCQQQSLPIPRLRRPCVNRTNKTSESKVDQVFLFSVGKCS